MNSRNITDFDIEALIDNELDWEDAKQVRLYVDANPDAKKRYEKLSQQKNLLLKWWKQSKPLN